MTQYIIKISTTCLNKWWCVQFNYFAVILGLVTFLTAVVSLIWPEIIEDEERIEMKLNEKGIDSVDETFVDDSTDKDDHTKDKLLLGAGIVMILTVIVVMFIFR